MCGKMGGGDIMAIFPKPHFRLKNPIFLEPPIWPKRPPHDGGGTDFFSQIVPPHHGGGPNLKKKSVPPHHGGGRNQNAPHDFEKCRIYPPPILK